MIKYIFFMSMYAKYIIMENGISKLKKPKLY
jgi:hypothetical protein